MGEIGEGPDIVEVLKPAVLYHASSNRNIEVLEPRAESVRSESEGPVVFATPDIAEASKFLVPSGDTWTKKGKFGDVHYTVISDKQRYEERDRGGTIYHLRANTFEQDKTKGTRTEWTSKVPVIPFGRDDFESGLQAQLDYGVQVYFVDTDTFAQIETSIDHGDAIIRSLVSENQIRNVNVREVPEFQNNETVTEIKA